MPLQPSRTVDELRELRELTGDEDGAQRVAWTDTWEAAREWLRGKLDGLGLEHEIDEAGNQWWTLPGASERAVLMGGHIDSVPNGGWLDGALNVVAGGRGPAPPRRGGRARRDRAPRRLGRRGGRALRALALRLERGLRDDGRPGRPAAAARRGGHRAPGRAPRARRRPRRRARGSPAARERGRLPRAPHRAGARARVAWISRSASSSGRSASSGTSSRGAARPPTRARRRWTSAATRSPAPRSSRSRSARSPRARARAPSARRGTSSASRAS